MTPNHEVKTLLIVDDSRVSRMMIRAIILDKRSDWVTLEASTGNEAIEIVDRDMPNCCTMDINMPGISGTDAAAQILDKYQGIRIAIFSANIQESHQTRAAGLRARFVSKPVTEKSVVQALAFFESKE